MDYENAADYLQALKAGTQAAVARRIRAGELIPAADLANRLGVTLVGGTPRQLGDLQKADSAKWAKVIRDGNIKLD